MLQSCIQLTFQGNVTRVLVHSVMRAQRWKYQEAWAWSATYYTFMEKRVYVYQKIIS